MHNVGIVISVPVSFTLIIYKEEHFPNYTTYILLIKILIFEDPRLQSFINLGHEATLAFISLYEYHIRVLTS